MQLLNTNKENNKLPVYERIYKPFIDKVLSFLCLIFFAPLLLILSIVIFIDDPGPIIFTQKRVGKNKKLFKLHKFRSMSMSAPHDVPTHKLKDPEKYITKTGSFLRKYSLDELPQIWDIFIGNMSFIGPRPALWNQNDLVKERDKYGANEVLPGLTGYAQTHGRDELEIPEKANMDGKYVKALHRNTVSGFLMDISCFFKTIVSVVRHDGVVEGEMKNIDGTGQAFFKTTVKFDEAGFEDYGYLKTFKVNKTDSDGIPIQKKVLITGANSYIGESFEQYAKQHYGDNFIVDTLDMRDESWNKRDFGSYDCVFHVAGIAHADIGNVSESVKKKYYEINTELAVRTAKKAKADGVKQFVLMSSVIIYGDSAGYGGMKKITEKTLPSPSSFYGDSKWQADKRVRQLGDNNFNVAVLRAPMIYGHGSKGNYPVLAKLAVKLPIFPDVKNKRSMLYIENLCEFLCLLILSGQNGVYFPQNKKYTKTADIVKFISRINGKKIHTMRFLNYFVALGSKMPGKIGGLINKAFGNLICDQKLSVYKGFDYQVASLKESIIRSEGKSLERPSVLMLVNHDVVIYNFRLELVERLLNDGYEVHISSPYGERIDDLVALGAKYHEIDIDRHGMNPISDFSILKEYNRLLQKIHPIIVLSYTIKPNIYGALIAQKARIPFVANITGLGIAMGEGGICQKLITLLYKVAFSCVQTVFFQNEDDKQFFKRLGIANGKHILIPGSGVNLNRYPISDYPECGYGKNGDSVKFAFISRIMKEKGIDQYLSAAKSIKKLYPAVEFHVCGFCEAEYEGQLNDLAAKEIIIYHGMIRDVAEFMSTIHCVVHPTYYPEGISNVLLEACSSGRPIITTNRSGCREVVKDGVNGYMVPEKDTKALIDAIEKFIKLTQSEKKNMGIEARKLVEQQFDRNLVVAAYMKEIYKVEGKA